MKIEFLHSFIIGAFCVPLCDGQSHAATRRDIGEAQGIKVSYSPRS